MGRTAFIAYCGLLSITLNISPTFAWDQTFDPGGNWYGGANFNDQTNQFDYCWVSSNYEGNIVLQFVMGSDFGIGIGLANDNWRLTPGSEFPLYLQVDRRWTRSLTGQALDQHTVFIPLHDDLDGFDALRRGFALSVQAARDTMEFELTGTAQALAGMARCVLANAATGSDPFSINPDPFSTAAPQQADPFSATEPRQAEPLTREAMAGFLFAAGLESAVLLTNAEREEAFPSNQFPGIQFAWLAGDAVGIMGTDVINGRTPDQMMIEVMQGAAETCMGDLTTGTKPDQAIGDIVLRRFVVSCEGAQTSFTYGTLAVGRAGVAVLMHIGFGPEGSEAAALADNMIADAFRTMEGE